MNAESIQNELFCHIDEYLYIGSDDLVRFKLLIRHHLSEVHLQPQKKFSDVCRELLKRGVIKLGDYTEVTDVVQKIDVRLVDEIKLKEEEIRAKVLEAKALESDAVPVAVEPINVLSDNGVSVELLLDFVASKLGQEVNILAVELNLDLVTVERIDHEYPRNPQEKNFQILYTWRNQFCRGDYRETLEKALCEQGRTDIVEIIKDFQKDKYRCPNVPDPETRIKEKDCSTVMKELSSGVYRLGRYLGVPQSKINQIKEDKVNDIVEQGYAILSSWTQSKAKRATRQWLCDGLVYIKSQTVIDKLCAKWKQ